MAYQPGPPVGVLEGDHTQHYALSRAVADFLTSPLNHNEGQTVPMTSTVPRPSPPSRPSLAVPVDFADSAIYQILEAIDLKYESEGGEPEDRWAEVQREAEFVRRVVKTIVQSKRDAGLGSTPEVLTSIKA